jgi:hypothetical protein
MDQSEGHTPANDGGDFESGMREASPSCETGSESAENEQGSPV